VKIKPIILMLTLLSPMVINGQRKQPPVKQSQPPTHVANLIDDYIKATKDYKASLEKLLALYQAGYRKAEDRMSQSKKLFADGLISPGEVERSEHALADANQKVIEVQQQISGADTQIAQSVMELQKEETTAKLAREYKRASARQPTCRNWTLTASRQQRGSTVTFAFKLVCKD
jgi:Outer membrane efflux protein